MKRVIAALMLSAIAVNTAQAIKTDPVLKPTDSAIISSSYTSYDVRNGAEVKMVPTSKGTVLVMVQGKIVAEVARESLDDLAGFSLNFRHDPSFELRYSLDGEVIVFEY